MVTIESMVRMGKNSWLLKYSSDLENPTFYIHLDGNLIAETEQTEYTIAVNLDESSLIEILDDPDETPIQIFPGKARLGWFFVEGTDYYRIDEYIDSEWAERRRLPENNGYLMWGSRFLEDGQTHLFRVVPVGTDGNEGTPKQLAVLMVRRPDVPDVDYELNTGIKRVVISDNDEPPEDMIYDCLAHYKMNDSAANTTVLDSMGANNGVSLRTTVLMSVAGKAGGNNALGFTPSLDGILVDTTAKPLGHPLTGISICFWFKTNVDYQTDIVHLQEDGLGEIFFSITSNGELQFNCGLKTLLSTTIISDNQWHYMVGTYGSDGTINLYIDNDLEATNSNTFNFEGGIDYQYYGHFDTNYFDGALDDVRIFKRALTAAERSFLFNGGNGTEDF